MALERIIRINKRKPETKLENVYREKYPKRERKIVEIEIPFKRSALVLKSEIHRHLLHSFLRRIVAALLGRMPLGRIE